MGDREVRKQTGTIVASSQNGKCAPCRPFPSIERKQKMKNLESADGAVNLAAQTAVTSNAASSRANGKIVERPGSKALLVLGMHRSGTSSIAGAMVRLGGAAPLNLLPPADDNPKGFWESSVLTNLNDQILAAGGSHWEDWRQFDPTRIDAAAAFALESQARSALAGEFGDAGLAVIKDPRMCRLMPFWSSVFREANWSVRPVLQLRSPLEVALSLNRRDRIPLGLGCLIWLRHVLDAEAGTRGTPRAVVDWNDFLGDPRRTLERVGEQLGVVWPRWSDSALAEIDEFVSADMRRQRASDSDLQVHPAVNHLVREAYAAVRELVENPASEKVGRTLADIRGRFDGAAAIFGHAMFELEGSHRARSVDATTLRNEYTTQLTAAREEFARQISEASMQLADARSEFARELAEAREEFAVRLGEARSECRRLVDEGHRNVARAEDIIAHLGRRYEPRSASAPKRRFRDYLRPHKKARKELTAIRNSAFFDREFYLNSNPDVRASGTDAAFHYLGCGGREGRDPGPFFSTDEYLARFPDVAASGVNALVHYEMYGRREMRKVPLMKP
jgi:hypothetical protein